MVEDNHSIKNVDGANTLIKGNHGSNQFNGFVGNPLLDDDDNILLKN